MSHRGERFLKHTVAYRTIKMYHYIISATADYGDTLYATGPSCE